MTADPIAPSAGSADDIERGYRSVREGIAAVPVARDVVRMTGADAVEYLQGQCSQDISALSVGTSADALLLEPRGKIDAFVRVTRAGDDELILDTDEGFGTSLITRLERFKLRVKVDIERLEWTCVSLRGPASRDVVAQEGSLYLPFDWPGLSGVDLLGKSPHVPDGVPQCPELAWEAVRIETGIPLMGHEIDEKTIPAEAGLVERCVSFTKGCFTGQELVARLDSRGSNVARRLRGIVVKGPYGNGDLARGAELVVDGKVVGSVTSAAWSPGMDATVALGYVHRSVSNQTSLTVGSSVAQARELPLVS